MFARSGRRPLVRLLKVCAGNNETTSRYTEPACEIRSASRAIRIGGVRHQRHRELLPAGGQPADGALRISCDAIGAFQRHGDVAAKTAGGARIKAQVIRFAVGERNAVIAVVGRADGAACRCSWSASGNAGLVALNGSEVSRLICPAAVPLVMKVHHGIEVVESANMRLRTNSA